MQVEPDQPVVPVEQGGRQCRIAGLADPDLGAALTRIRDAMTAHPELIAGERRQFDTDLMRAAPGRLVAKWGAEGLQGVGVLAGAIGAGAVRTSGCSACQSTAGNASAMSFSVHTTRRWFTPSSRTTSLW